MSAGSISARWHYVTGVLLLSLLCNFAPTAAQGPAVLLRTGRRLAPSAQVKEEAASQLTAEAVELYNQGQLHDALQHYIDAAQEARFGGHISVAAATENLGLCLLAMDMKDAAVTKLQEALDTYTKVYTKVQREESKDMFGVRMELAEAYMANQKHDDALSHAQQAWEAAQKLYTEADSEYRRALTVVGAVRHARKEYAEAVETLERARDLVRVHAGDGGQEELVLALTNVAAVKEAMGDDGGEALKLCQEALGAARKSSKDGPGTALWHALETLALYHRARRDFTSARSLYEEMVAQARRSGDTQGAELLRVINELATGCAALGDYTCAKDLLQEALDVTKAQFTRKRRRGDGIEDEEEMVLSRQDHEVLYPALMNLAQAFHHTGELDQAEPLYLQAIDTLSNLGLRGKAESSNPKTRLGDFYREKGERSRAREMYQSAVEALREVLPGDHAEVVKAEKRLEAFNDVNEDSVEQSIKEEL